MLSGVTPCFFRSFRISLSAALRSHVSNVASSRIFLISSANTLQGIEKLRLTFENLPPRLLKVRTRPR